MLTLVAYVDKSSLLQEEILDEDGNRIKVGSYAKPGEPVIPAFPVGSDCNHFISTTTAKRAMLAKVAEVKDTPDSMTARLVKEYPGLPAKYLEEIVIKVTVCMYKNKLDMMNKVYRVFLSGHAANLQDVENTDNLIPIWGDLDPANYM